MPTPKDLAEGKASTPTEKDEPMITYREAYTDKDGAQNFHEHTVPVKDWPAYEKEHGF